MIFQGAMLGAGDQHQGLPSGPSAGNETLQPISLSLSLFLLVTSSIPKDCNF